MTYVCKKFASFHQLKFSTDVDVDQEWKLPILHELLKVREDNFVLNNFDDNEIATFYVPTRNYIYILYFILVFVLSYCSILPLCTK